jgi:hypothetical protein
MQHRSKHVALCMPAHLIKRLQIDRLAIARVNNVRAGEKGETRELGEENLQRRPNRMKIYHRDIVKRCTSTIHWQKATRKPPRIIQTSNTRLLPIGQRTWHSIGLDPPCSGVAVTHASGRTTAQLDCAVTRTRAAVE